MGSSQSSQPLLSSSLSESIRPTESIIDGGAPITENKNENEDQITASNQLNMNFSSYETPKSPVHPIAHYIFLVHGWLGNGLEMDYLSSAIQGVLESKDDKNLDPSSTPSSSSSSPVPGDGSKRMRKSNSYESRILANQYITNNNNNKSSDDGLDHDNTMAVAVPDIIIHSVKCNVGRTHDGIRMGGTRLANEIIHFIRSDFQKRQKQSRMDSDDATRNHAVHDVTYSIVGNSLGGLYARYALSLIPYRIPLLLQQQQQQTLKEPTETRQMLHLHPNVFCTTATPHLGVSRHTYLPIPRIAEKLIGTGMGTTGRDLFRLNSEKEPATGASRGESVRLPFKYDTKMDDSSDNDAGVASQSTNWGEDDEEMECIIRNMCLQEKYLSPLRNFRRRIAYANVYGTDFQVPTATAAFLNERSEVGHVLVASRELPMVESSNDCGQEHGVLPSFIVAVVCTEKQSQRQSPSNSDGVNVTTPTDELLEMSRSLDALGWTKVFVDVRDRIPIPGLARPSWFLPRYDSLDDLIRERIGFTLPLTNNGEIMTASSKRGASDTISPPPLKSLQTNADTCSGHCILTSQDLSQSTQVSDSIHFPMGHTVMIANTKNEQYSQWNRLGRPVMDRLAEEMVKNILEFE